MIKFKFITKDNIWKLPKTPGIYLFKEGRKILYIGKAGNLKERVKNHFHPVKYRKVVILPKAKLFNRVKQIGYLKTDSEIEALILEANLIKKHQPKYNVLWKDDKNYFFIEVTREEFPRFFLTHQPRISDFASVGPFVDGKALKQTLKILRKIFPYYTARKHPKTPCLWCQLGYCPGPKPDRKNYRKNIKNLIAVLSGKRKDVLRKLKKEMKLESRLRNFEKAAKIRDQIRALEKIVSQTKIFEPDQSVNDWQKIAGILQKILKVGKGISRIEAYDVSNIQGQEATGSMVTFVNGRSDRNFYRRFKIKISGKANDTAMIKEVLNRRFKHYEWGWPDLILIDGGKPQLNTAINFRNQAPLFKQIKIMALAKKKNELFIENQKKPILLKNLPRQVFNLVLQVRDEAHRFAKKYHQKLREVDLMKGF